MLLPINMLQLVTELNHVLTSIFFLKKIWPALVNSRKLMGVGDSITPSGSV
jgi:hypothetical protein